MPHRKLLALAAAAALAAVPAVAKEERKSTWEQPYVVAPPSGHIVIDPPIEPMPMPQRRISSSQVRRLLRAAGYRRIHDAEFDDGSWEDEARNRADRRVKLRLPPDGSAIYESPDWDDDDDDDDDD